MHKMENALLRKAGCVGPGIAVLMLVGAPAATSASPQEATWARFRGPHGSGIATVTGLPVECGPDQGVIW